MNKLHSALRDFSLYLERAKDMTALLQIASRNTIYREDREDLREMLSAVISSEIDDLIKKKVFNVVVSSKKSTY